MDVYDTEGCKKDATYLADTLMERIRLLEKRGWKVKGCVTDNANAELASMELVKKKYEAEFKRLFVILTCGMHTASLAQADVFPWPSHRKQYAEKHGGQQGPWKPFDAWIAAIDLADEISMNVRNSAKLRAQLHKVITETERFKNMKPLMPIQGSSVKMWTRTLVTHRFQELHDAILYMLKWQNNKVLKTMVDDKSRARFYDYVQEMEHQKLAVTLREAMGFLTPLYFFQKYCDANYPGSFSVAIAKWNDMAQKTTDAIRTAGGTKVTERIEYWESVLQNRKLMFLTAFHGAMHVLRPDYMLNTSLEDVAPMRKEALRKALAEFFKFAPDKQACVQQAMKVWTAMLKKEDPYGLTDGAGERQAMWAEAAEVSCHGSQDKTWWQMHVGSAGDAKGLYDFVNHLLDLRVSEAGCERAFSVISHVQEGRDQLKHNKLQQLTHIYWGYRTLNADHKRRRMIKLQATLRAPGEDIHDELEEEFDESYEPDGLPQHTNQTNLAEALDMPAEDIAVGISNNPLDDHAALAVPKILAITAHLEGDDMRTDLFAIPVFEQLKKMTVTQASLKSLHVACKTLQKYKSHDDPMVAIVAQQLMGAWRKIFVLGAESKYTCADELLIRVS